MDEKIPKMFITLVVFSLGYYVFDCYTNTGIVFSWKEFAIKLYSYNLKYHLWYLYLYIAYLILLPFLNAMVKNLSDKDFKYLIVCYVDDISLEKGRVSLSLINPNLVKN